MRPRTPDEADLLYDLQSWTKVLGHFCVSGAFSNSHKSNPSPHPTNNVARVFIQNFFLSTLYRVGGVRTARQFRKGCTVLRGNREMTEKQEYCSTLPRTSYMCVNYFFTGNVSNAIRFMKPKIDSLCTDPPSLPIFIERRGSVHRLKIDFSIFEKFHKNFLRILREINVK